MSKRGVLALFFGQLLTMVPTWAPTSFYAPQLVTKPYGLIAVLGLALGIALILASMVAGIRRVAAPYRLGPRGIAALLAGLTAIQIGAAAYYSRFGNYPTGAVARDFLDSPGPFVAYSLSGASWVDFLGVSIVLGIGVALMAFAAGAAWRKPVRWSTAAIACGVGSALVLAIAAAPITRDFGFVVSEHSLPSVKFASSLVISVRGNNVEAFRTWLPRPSGPPSLPAIPRVKHVLVIVAEALRADHLPHYGYSTNTTPYLFGQKDRWIRFARAYAHGSRTADSFPVLFNSRYFAAVDRTSAGASAFWASLRSTGVGTSVLSAGALEWGGIKTSIAFQEIDQGLMASDFPADMRRQLSWLPFAFAVDDALPKNRYLELMAGPFGRNPSFTVLHFIGSHYPFQNEASAPEVADQPSGATKGQDGASENTVVQTYDVNWQIGRAELGAITRAYDAGIRRVDQTIGETIDGLAKIGILEDSVVIVTSDHGESLGEHRTLFHGTTLYDEQVRVPLLVRVGANLGPIAEAFAERADGVAGLIDVLPTVHDLMTGGQAQPKEFEGLSWLDRRRKPYELLLFRGIGEKVGIVSHDRKYLLDVTGRRAEEYELATDANEQRNLWPPGRADAPAFIEALGNRRVIGGF